MITPNDTECPKCGGKLQFYDVVKRFVIGKYGQKELVNIARKRCIVCKSTHRELPYNVSPFKHYDKDIIDGVIEGIITSETIGFEDYPCEMTMSRWCAQNLHTPL